MSDLLSRRDRAAARISGALRNDILLTLLLCAINFCWFMPFMSKGIIMGDDLGVVMSRDLSFLDAIIPKGSKYRPVYSFFAILSAHLFDDCYELYFLLNVLMNIAVSLLLYFLLKRITADKRYISFAMTVMFILSPFVYYNITQVLGFMESLCLLLMLAVFHFALSYWRGKKSAIYYAVLAALLLTFTHERYIVLSPWLVILVLCAEHEKIRVKLPKLIACMIPLATNYFLKTFVFQSDFLVGTGGTSVSFDIRTVLTFFDSGLKSIFGINDGVEYLVGIGFSRYPTFQRVMSIIVVSLSFLLLFVYIWQRVVRAKERKERIRELKYLLIAAAAIGALLISGCITIRLEQRWISAPFIAYLVYFGYIVSKIRFPAGRLLRNTVLVALVAASFQVNLLQHECVWQIYFSRAMYVAKNFYNAAIFKYGESLSDYTVYIMANNELQWAIGTPNLSMFDVYLDNEIDFKYADTMEQINEDYLNTDPSARKPAKVFRMDGSLNVTEVSTATLGMKHESDFSDYEYEITPDLPADTPTGEGVFFNGATSFTVLSGYSMIFEDVMFPEDAVVYFECNMPYAISDGSYVTVTLHSAQEESVLTAFPIYPTDAGSFSIEIDNQQIFYGDLTISVSSPSGDMSADWVNFITSGIYTDPLDG